MTRMTLARAVDSPCRSACVFLATEQEVPVGPEHLTMCHALFDQLLPSQPKGWFLSKVELDVSLSNLKRLSIVLSPMQ